MTKICRNFIVIIQVDHDHQLLRESDCDKQHLSHWLVVHTQYVALHTLYTITLLIIITFYK